MRDRKAEYEANKEQIKTRSSAWYAANRERAKAARKAHYHANKAAMRALKLERKYGLKAGEYEARLQNQDGHCAICPATVADARGGALHVDHDHATGKVRGLLCGRCNNALGSFEDDSARFERAAAYLRRTA